jgi:hypothetical protein
MTTNKIEIDNDKFDINLKFYFFLKHLVKSKLTPSQISGTLEICSNPNLNSWVDCVRRIERLIEKFNGQKKKALPPKLCYPDQVHEENLAK